MDTAVCLPKTEKDKKKILLELCQFSWKKKKKNSWKNNCNLQIKIL